MVALALFIPLIISSGGNSGSQASTLVIRALALGEVGLMDWWRIMRREIVAGVSLGVILGVIGFIRITIWNRIVSKSLWRDMAFAGDVRGTRVGGDCVMGVAGRIRPAYGASASGLRSGRIICAICGDVGRRDRIDYLLHSCADSIRSQDGDRLNPFLSFRM